MTVLIENAAVKGKRLNLRREVKKITNRVGNFPIKPRGSKTHTQRLQAGSLSQKSCLAGLLEIEGSEQHCTYFAAP